MKDQISHLRTHYSGKLLDEKTVLSNPFDQFTEWFKEALNDNVTEPNAMTLATSSKQGQPSVRIVLLKDFTKSGFTFYTNYHSQKAKDINENPHGALLFFWPQQFRQIRIEGVLEQVPPSVSEKYFHERPFESRISSWISPQSTVIDDKTILEKNYADFEKKHSDKEIPYPVFWGGYCLKPSKFEFWQGQPNRLHDRVVYLQQPESDIWSAKRLAP